MNNINILLVEDDAGDAGIIQHKLRFSGVRYKLAWVQSLKELTDYYRDQPHTMDVILLDLNLTDVMGLDTIKACRKMAPQTPVVVLTGYDDANFALHALKAGALDYIVKSQLDIDSLLRALYFAVSRHRQDDIEGYAVGLAKRMPWPNSAENVSILVVDDDPLFRKLLTSILKKNGFRAVIELSSGEEAVDYAGNNTVHIVFLDIEMPSEMNGYKTLDALKQQQAGLSVIMVSAFSTLENVNVAIEKGAEYFLVKPVEPGKVINIVREIHRQHY